MEKRQLPTRHNFLTEAVQNLLESRTNINNEPSFDGRSILTITSEENVLKEYTCHDIPKSPSVALPDTIKNRTFKVIEPVRAKKGAKENIVPDDYYLKRHRKNEINEKKQKNREKEKLRHGYYQQKLLVDRIKAMDKSILQSIVSSIRHRTDQKEQDDIDEIHQQLLDESMDILRRYESLGFHSPDNSTTTNTIPATPATTIPTTTTTTTTTSNTGTTTATTNTNKDTKQEPVESAFQKSLKTQKKRITPIKVMDHPKEGVRRSTRTVTAFGQKLPSFENQEFELPSSILDFKKEED